MLCCAHDTPVPWQMDDLRKVPGTKLARYEAQQQNDGSSVEHQILSMGRTHAEQLATYKPLYVWLFIWFRVSPPSNLVLANSVPVHSKTAMQQ